MLNVLGLGDNVVDVYLHTNTMYPGGNALNFAVFARQLGYSSAYLGVFGDDTPAAHVYQVASSLGLDLSHCRFHPGENGLARVTIQNGDRVFLPGNKGGISKHHPIVLTHLDEAYIKTFDLVHSSCYSYSEDIMPQIKALGVRTSFDFSDRIDQAYLLRVAPHLDFAILSCGHLQDPQIHELLDAVSSLGPSLVLATRGSRGAILHARGQIYEQSPCLVEAIDTMAAGDSFLTALICTYLDGMNYAADFPLAGGMMGLTSKDQYEIRLIETSLHKAAVYSSQTCLQSGSFGFGTDFRL